MDKMILVFSVFFAYFCESSCSVDWSLKRNDHRDISPKLQPLRIIGGVVAIPHAYPYQAALLINSRSLCGGSLISQNYILTAAHCAAAVDGSLDIILGAHNITDPESTQVHIDPADIIIHENYSSKTYQNDIALIKLRTPAPLSNVINTITLPLRSDANKTYDNQTVTSIGWGLTKDVTNPSLRDISSVLMVVNVSVMSLKECDDFYYDQQFNIHYVSEINICTSGQNNKGTCNGDSGGPLISEGKQIGLVSVGSTLCEISSPSVFTSVGRFLDWIQLNSDVIIY